MPYPLERPIDTKSAQKTPLFLDRQGSGGAGEKNTGFGQGGYQYGFGMNYIPGNTISFDLLFYPRQFARIASFINGYYFMIQLIF